MINRLLLTSLQLAAWKCSKRESMVLEDEIAEVSEGIASLQEEGRSLARQAARRYDEVLCAIFAEHGFEGQIPEDTRLVVEDDKTYFVYGPEVKAGPGLGPESGLDPQEDSHGAQAQEARKEEEEEEVQEEA